MSDLPPLSAQAPVAALGMWCVPQALRPLGISMMTITIHLLGDVPSPPLLGLIQTGLSQARATPLILRFTVGPMAPPVARS